MYRRHRIRLDVYGRSLGSTIRYHFNSVAFLWNAAHGDLGVSIRTSRPVASEIADNLPSTLQLALAALTVAALIGVPLGILAGVRPRSTVDLGATLLALLGASL